MIKQCLIVFISNIKSGYNELGLGLTLTISNFVSCLRTILRFRDQSMKLGPFSLSFSRTDLSEKTFVLFEAISKLQRKTFARLDMRAYLKTPTITN